MTDPRFTIRKITVQGLPPTTQNPKKRLSHTSKATPSAPITGAFQPIATRIPLLRKARKR